MLRQEEISGVIDAQKVTFLQKGNEIPRNALADVPIVENFATIITGIRRCGKSTL
jgi:predicted AAA+ superfamily ATPase